MASQVKVNLSGLRLSNRFHPAWSTAESRRSSSTIKGMVDVSLFLRRSFRSQSRDGQAWKLPGGKYDESEVLSLLMPSRTRVLTVPSGWPRRCEISDWLKPSK